MLHVPEDSHLLACDTVLLGERFLVFFKDHSASLVMVSQFLDSLTFEIVVEPLIQGHSVTFHKALILIQLRFCLACFLPSMHMSG